MRPAPSRKDQAQERFDQDAGAQTRSHAHNRGRRSSSSSERSKAHINSVTVAVSMASGIRTRVNRKEPDTSGQSHPCVYPGRCRERPGCESRGEPAEEDGRQSQWNSPRPFVHAEISHMKKP
jgi:hypothetical protein